jgi:hypothetical protein
MPQTLLLLSDYRSKYPEFAGAPDALVNKALSDAAEQLDAGVWGSYLQQAHGLLASHLLALSPSGQFARLENEPSETTYYKAYKDLRYAVTSCIRVF